MISDMGDGKELRNVFGMSREWNRNSTIILLK
jgi:hypothetical protein